MANYVEMKTNVITRVFADGDTEYICEAQSGSLPTESKWAIEKIDKSVTDLIEITHAFAIGISGANQYKNTCIDLVDVKNASVREYK